MKTVIACFILLITLALGAFFSIGPFSQPEPPVPPMSLSSQCIIHGKWCMWPVCGTCKGDRPACISGLGL
jgi:hypothetical protein